MNRNGTDFKTRTKKPTVGKKSAVIIGRGIGGQISQHKNNERSLPQAIENKN